MEINWYKEALLWIQSRKINRSHIPKVTEHHAALPGPLVFLHHLACYKLVLQFEIMYTFVLVSIFFTATMVPEDPCKTENLQQHDRVSSMNRLRNQAEQV